MDRFENVIVPLGSMGYLEAMASPDPSYPGVDIEFNPKERDENVLSNPRVLIELPDGDEHVRALVWNRSDEEDYGESIDFYAHVNKATGDSYVGEVRKGDKYFEVIVPGSGKFVVSTTDENCRLYPAIKAEFIPDGEARSESNPAVFMGLAEDGKIKSFSSEPKTLRNYR